MIKCYYDVIGAVNRRCMGDNQWDESIECFIDETKMLFDQVITKLKLILINAA